MSAPRSALLPGAAELRLERDSPIALHRQLAQVLRDAIAQLEHRAGDLERGLARMRWLGAGFIDSQDLVGTQTA